MAKLTREQFATAYAALTGVTVEQLRAYGREPRPCDCGEDGCKGWQMAYVREEREMGYDWPEDSPCPVRATREPTTLTDGVRE